MTITFQVDGQDFVALNGGPFDKFTHAISLMVNCKTQDEIDDLWKKLSDGGQIEECGWLRDKYGMSWQIVSAVLSEMLQDEDSEKAEKVMSAMLKIKKLEIQGLKDAYKK